MTMITSPMVKIKDEIVYRNDEPGANYNSFPSAVLLPSGKIVLTFRQARDLRHVYGETRHLDSHSRAVLLTSEDGGQTWDQKTRLLYDHFIYGIQDPCLNLLADGTILATFFMWKVLAPEDTGEKQERDLIYYDKWVGRPAGLFSIRSTDGGDSWDEPVPVTPVPMSIRGKGVQLADGSFVVAAYKYLPGCIVHIFRTTDKGLSWEELSTIEHPNGCDEPFLYLAPSGKIVAFIRSDWFDIDVPESAPLLTAESLDGGSTWSTPVERPFHTPGPFDAVRLQSGRVAVTWGRRFPPFGIHCIFLDAECEDWDNVQEEILRENCEDEDIGYTSSIQLPDGDIKTFYYYMDNASGGYRYISCSTYREA